MKKYVWLIWDHDEYGPEKLFAFGGRDKALEYALSYYKGDTDEARRAQKEVADRFPPDTKTDEELAWELNFSKANSWPLCDGWGGLHLTVTGIDE